MTDQSEWREPVRIVMHLNGGYTRVALLRTGHHWDVRTDKIPAHLCQVGAEMLLVAPRRRADEDEIEYARSLEGRTLLLELAGDETFTEGH